MEIPDERKEELIRAVLDDHNVNMACNDLWDRAHEAAADACSIEEAAYFAETDEGSDEFCEILAEALKRRLGGDPPPPPPCPPS